MANPASENLYLLEFLVNDVTIDGAGKCTCKGSAGELCVSFQFLDNPQLKVCERDFSPDQKFSNERSRIGKSCIFSLTPKQAQTACKSFDLNVAVHRKTDSEKSTEADAIGSAVIPITNLLVDLLKKGSAPAAKVLEDKYTLNNSKKAKVGSIDAYIRLSCYGKMIITQFQMNMNDKTVLFKDKDGRSLYRYRKRKSSKTTKMEDVSAEDKGATPKEAGPQNPNCPSQSCFPPAKESRPHNPGCPSQPCFPNGFPSDFTGTPPCIFDQGIVPGYGAVPGWVGQSGPGGSQPQPPCCLNYAPPPSGVPYGGGGFTQCSLRPSGPGMQNFDMFYPPTLTQQASTFPSATYDQRMSQQQQFCQGPCGRQ